MPDERRLSVWRRIKDRAWRSTLAMVLWRWRVCDAERQKLKHRVRELEAALRGQSD